MNGYQALSGVSHLGYAVLHMDSQRLLLPQNDIAILELVDRIQPVTAEAPLAVGELPFAGRQWPVYCLRGADLRPTAAAPPARHICALMHDGSGSYVGLLCDTVEQLGTGEVVPQPIPTCMRGDDMLITELVMHGEDSVLWASNAQRLSDWLESVLSRQHAKQDDGRAHEDQYHD